MRETVQAALSPRRASASTRRCCASCERAGRDDHDWLHTLALGAGQRAPAFRYGLLAAERASESLAFERASELYSKCLVLFDGEMELYVLWMKLAAAQAHCRRGYEAAKAYSSAAEHAPAAKRGELLQLAASHLVRSGRFEEGERIVQQVLEAQKCTCLRASARCCSPRWAGSTAGSRCAASMCRIAAARAGQPALGETALLYGTLSDRDAAVRAAALSLVPSARVAAWRSTTARPTQVARALCLAAAVACVSGTQRARARSQSLLNRAERAVQAQNADQASQLELLCARAVCAQFLGNIGAALGPADAVERADRSQRIAADCTATTTTCSRCRWSASLRCRASGDSLEARQALHEHIGRARATDNLAAILQVTMNRVVDEQALDMCAGSRARLDAEYAQLPKGDFGVLTVAHCWR